MKNIKDIYKLVIDICSEQEKETYQFLSYENGDYVSKDVILDNKLCLNLRIKNNRMIYFLDYLNENDINYTIKYVDKYCQIIKIFNDDNYIIFDYVVNSHVIIPKSILKHFGKKTENGWFVSYYSFSDKKILFSNIKKYGTEYGYYDMKIEERISKEYEQKFDSVTAEIAKFVRGGNQTISLNKELIHSFLDITVYRRPDFTVNVNKRSNYEINHNQILDLVTSIKIPHVFYDLEINIIMNKTSKSFLVSKSLNTTISVSGNEMIIFPVNPKFCIVLMEKEYYKQWKLNNYLYYMLVDDEKEVDKINKSVFSQAMEDSEDVIGDEYILEEIIQKYNFDI